MIGGVGQRMLTGVAKKTAAEFFAAVDRALAGACTGAAGPAAAAPWRRRPTAPTLTGRRGRRREPSGACRTAGRRPPGGRAARLPAGPRRAGVALPVPLVGAAIALAGVVVGGLRRPAAAGLVEGRSAMRAFTAAAVQVAPVPGPLTAGRVKSNVDKCVELVERCVAGDRRRAGGAARVGHHRVHPGRRPETLWDLVDDVPGPLTEPIQEVAARLGVHLVLGTYERGPAPRHGATTPPR